MTVATGLVDALQDTLAAALADKRARCAEIDETVAAAADVLAEFVLGGGKRLRPTFAWHGWLGAGGAAGLDDTARPGAVGGAGDAALLAIARHDDRDAAGATAGSVLRAVSSLELLQAAALVHDDVLDASTTRRGRPTVHVRLAAEHRARGWLGDPDRFGEAAAVLIGDLALAWADDVLRESGVGDDALRRAQPVWAAVRTEVLAGQYLDVRAQATGDESVDGALRVALFKSAAYTVARPLQLGGALAGASGALLAAYHRFGSDIGVAFQLRDDVLGVFGDPAVTGKPAGDDLREGKRTLLVAHALRHGRAADPVRAALGAADLDASTLAAAQATLIELGAVAAVEDRITALTESALAVLADAPVEPTAAAALRALALAATQRTF